MQCLRARFGEAAHPYKIRQRGGRECAIIPRPLSRDPTPQFEVLAVVLTAGPSDRLGPLR